MQVRQAGKRGKNAAKKVALGTLGNYAKTPLPPAPKSFDYSTDVADYPMALNDQLGDCTIAGVVHLLQLAYAEIGEVFQYPGDAAVRSTYMTLSGGADTGLVEHDVLQTWMQQGLFGTKILAYAPLDIKNHDELASAIYMFGAVYMGVEMPQNAEQQFEAHQPWHIDGIPEPPSGGHCIVATGANSLGIDHITWGAVESMTWEWWDTYGSEAWVIVPEVFVEADHGPVWTVDILALQKDIQNL